MTTPTAPDPTRYEEHDCGFSWMPDETLRRTSHALADSGAVWLIDPVDVPAALERAASLGTPAAVVQLRGTGWAVPTL